MALQKHFESAVSLVLQQVSEGAAPLDVHCKLERLKVEAEDDAFRFCMDIDKVYSHTTEDVLAKVGRNHGRDLHKEYTSAAAICAKFQAGISLFAEVCSVFAILKSESSQESLVSLSSKLSEIKALLPQLPVDVATDFAALEAGCGVQDLSRQMYVDASAKFKKDSSAMVEAAVKVFAGEDDNVLKKLAQTVKSQEFKLLQMSGSSPTPMLDRAGITFMSNSVCTLCLVPQLSSSDLF